MRWFASHGWVVIAPDHTGNTFSDHRDPLPSSHFIARPRDIGALLDALDSLPADDPLSGVVDTGRVVLSGHSFGAYTTWSAAGAAFDMDRIREACQGGGGALPAAARP